MIIDLHELREKYIEASKNKGLASSYVKSKDVAILSFIEFVEKNGIELKDIEYEKLRDIVDKYKSHLNSTKSESIAFLTIKELPQFMRYCAGYIPYETILHAENNNIYHVKKPPQKKQQYITQNEFKNLVSYINTSPELTTDIYEKHLLVYFLLFFLFYTGCRASEVLSIRVSDVKKDPTYSELASCEILGKGSKYRTVFLSKEVIRAMIPYLKHRSDNNDKCEFLFAVNKKGVYKKISYNKLNEYIKYAYDLAGLDHNGVHPLRRGFATMLIEKGTPVETVSELLGHNSISATNLYINVSDIRKKEAYLNAIDPLHSEKKKEKEYDFIIRYRGEKEDRFSSIAEAVRATPGANAPTIKVRCRKKSLYKGYYWKFGKI